MSDSAKRRQEDDEGELDTKRPTLTETETTDAPADSTAPVEQNTSDDKATESTEDGDNSNDNKATESTEEKNEADTATTESTSEQNGQMENPNPLPEGHVEETVDVADDQVGRIIGSKGANVRMIEASSGATINIPQTCVEGTQLRRVSIRGDVDAVRRAKETLESQIRSDGGDPNNADANKNSIIHYVPDEHVGRVIGRGGSTIRHIQELSKAHMDIAKECKPGQNVREITIAGSDEEIAKCKEYIDMKVRGESLPASNTRSQNECIITIPDEMTGRIIGKGGQTIRQLQDQSGAHMDVAKAATPGTDKREIILRNQPQQIAYCTYLINTKIAEITGDYTRNFVEGPPEVLTAAANMGAMHAQLKQQQMMQQYYQQPQQQQHMQMQQHHQPQQQQQGGQQQYYNPYQQYYQQQQQQGGQQQMYAAQQQQPQQYQQYYQQ